jgi:hypothetical protein
MSRKAFELVLELKERRDGPARLAKALAFLEVLARDRTVKSIPVMLSIRALRLRNS